MAHPDSQEERIAALDVAVRDLTARLDRVISHLGVAQDKDVARVFERYPDMLADLPRLN